MSIRQLDKARCRSSSLLVAVGATLLLTVAVLLVLLATLPHHEPFLADTISTDAYGAHRTLVFLVLLLFGLGTATLGLCLGLRLGGGAGWCCGGLVAVWAAASIFDAFVRTSPAHTGTSFGQLHTQLAVCGIAAQLVVAVIYLVIARRRLGGVPPLLIAVTGLVLAGVVFVAVHPDSLAGLCERVLFAASALWMVTCAHLARATPMSAHQVGARP